MQKTFYVLKSKRGQGYKVERLEDKHSHDIGMAVLYTDEAIGMAVLYTDEAIGMALLCANERSSISTHDWVPVIVDVQEGQIAQIIEGWHQLYVGANGHITNGITVRKLGYESGSGYRYRWEINDCTFTSEPGSTKRALGLSDEEYARYCQSLSALVEKQAHEQ